MRNRALALALMLASATPAAADQIELLGGGSIAGRVLEQDERRVVVEIGPGRITLPAARVLRIARGASPLDVFEERARRLGSADVLGWLDLAHWARERELHTQARSAFEHVLAVDPKNASANAALGNVLVGGNWLTPADANRARGYVQFEGEWMSPEQRDDLLRERAERRAAENARLEAEARAREAEARARAAEAEARRAEADARYEAGGIPYPYVYGPGAVISPPFVGGFDPYCDRPVPKHGRSNGHTRGLERGRIEAPPPPRERAVARPTHDRARSAPRRHPQPPAHALSDNR